MDASVLMAAITKARVGFVQLNFLRTPSGKLCLKQLVKAGAVASPSDRGEVENVIAFGWSNRNRFSLKLGDVPTEVLRQLARDIEGLG